MTEQSCIRCEQGRDNRPYFEAMGPLMVPRGVHVGVRFHAGCVGCSGASYTGDIAVIHVSLAAWKRVYIEKYLECTGVVKVDDAVVATTSVDDLAKQVGRLRAELRNAEAALHTKLGISQGRSARLTPIPEQMPQTPASGVKPPTPGKQKTDVKKER
jgi:hypothetical protein